LLKINLIKNYRVYPAVWYTHYLLNKPIKTMVYKKFPFKNHTSMNIFAKIMAMIHDYILCSEQDYGIQYGTIIYYD
jgi:hypothetical protein